MESLPVILFDLDDTLLDGDGHASMLARVCETVAASIGVPADRLRQANGEVWSGYWPEVRDGWTLGVVSGAAVTQEAWRRTLCVCGSADEDLVRWVSEVHSRCARQEFHLFDDAQRVLDLLSSRLPVGLITNGSSDTQREKLSATGAGRYFKATVISGELGVAKPDPAIFQIALDKMGVAATNTWFVGDSLATDVAGARSAGLTAVWLNRHGIRRQATDPAPDREITSLTDLLPLVHAKSPLEVKGHQSAEDGDA